MSQNWGYPERHISTPAWGSDPPFHMQSIRSPTETYMYQGLGLVRKKTGSTNVKVAKSSTLTLG